MADRVTWVILAGGRGTRSENPGIPKLLQQVGDTDILGLLLDSLPCEDDVDLVFVLRHGADAVREALHQRRGLYPKAEMRFVFDEGMGPVAALKQVKSIPHHETLAVVLGDTAIVAPLRHYLELYLSRSNGMPAITVRQSDHLQDSNAVALDWEGKPTKLFGKGEALDLRAGMIWGMTGLMFLKAETLKSLDGDQPDVASAILEANSLSEVQFMPTSHFFRDSGTPSRIAGIREALSSSPALLKTLRNTARPGLFLDRDGTLIPNLPRGRKNLTATEINLDVVASIRQANQSGLPVVLCTNQPAIAKGFISFEDCYEVHNKLQAELRLHGVRLDDVRLCPHHPEVGHLGEVVQLKVVCNCRKPDSAMVLAAAESHGITLTKETYFIGDSEVDRETAKNSNLEFIEVSTLKTALNLGVW